MSTGVELNFIKVFLGVALVALISCIDLLHCCVAFVGFRELLGANLRDRTRLGEEQVELINHHLASTSLVRNICIDALEDGSR